MSRLANRGHNAADVAHFTERANGPHSVRWKASSYWWSNGVQTLLREDIPITGGTLSLDSSDPIRRHLTLEVAGVGELVPNDPADALAPFGQYLILWMTIDRADGSWFNWSKVGEFPIQTCTSEWPSMIQTVEAADWSKPVQDHLHGKKHSYNHMTIHNAVKTITEASLHDRAFSIYADAESYDVRVEPNSVAEAGSSRWDYAVELCQARGFETFFQHDGDLVIRKDITNDDDNSIPAVGPDIGSVSDPIAIIRDGEGGNLVALTSSVTREGGCSGAFITLHETASQSLRRHGRRVAGDRRVNVTVQALGTGPLEWGGRYPKQPYVVEKPVKVITDDIVAAQTRRAKRILHKRGGVIRSLDLDAVGLYWVEPDDRVRVQYAGRTEYHFVSSIEFDLSGQSPARIRTRSLNTQDPG